MTHSFPTRRASELLEAQAKAAETRQSQAREALDNLQRERDSELGLAEQLAGLHRQLDEWRQAERETEALRELWAQQRSEEHTSELQSLMRISYAVFCLKKKINTGIPHRQ